VLGRLRPQKCLALALLRALQTHRNLTASRDKTEALTLYQRRRNFKSPMQETRPKRVPLPADEHASLGPQKVGPSEIPRFSKTRIIIADLLFHPLHPLPLLLLLLLRDASIALLAVLRPARSAPRCAAPACTQNAITARFR
jgi:hypothetical protein